MSKPQLKLVRGGLSSSQVDEALAAFYLHVLPLLSETEDTLSRKGQELLISSLIADYAIMYDDLGNFKDEVEESLLPLIKNAMAMIPGNVIRD